ncbi:glycosyltransferase [Georgenia sp. AZ-5]|uniref:glycosyltransferase n=1 Tax=Georgenia sp. AZ-5 TaxID=3367526 RepID=UPI003754E8D6
MHVVLPAIGSAGDVLPVVALGAALRARGHRVTVLTSPYHREPVEGAGLELVALGTTEQFVRVMDDSALWHPVKGPVMVARRAILPLMRPVYDYLSRLETTEVVVVASILAFGARIARERLGVRLVTLHLQPAGLLSAYDNAEIGPMKVSDRLPVRAHSWRLKQLDRISDRVVGPAVNRYRAELGLPPVSRVLGRWVHSPDGALGLFPHWFAPPQPDWPANIRLTGFVQDRAAGAALSREAEEFLADGNPPVVVTFGSAMVHGRRIFAEAVKANRLRGRRTVLLTRFRHQLPDTLPDDVLHLEWVPLGRLLPPAAAVVHHGGIGTLAQGLAAGIPQLVVPFSHDQPDNANRLRALGVAERLDPRRFTAERAALVLDRLVCDPLVQARCRHYARRVDFARAAQEAVTVIESL